MFDNVNTELQLLAQQVYEDVVDILYEDYIDELLANEEMIRYASYSYDNDCQYYGMQ